MAELSHVNKAGEAHMVDVGGKQETQRIARATAEIVTTAEVIALLQENRLAKGDVLAVARIAGIQAAKKCADLIPLCHPLALSSIDVEFEIDSARCAIVIFTRCKLNGRTGVEMEALTAASVAALTIYDMCKAVDKGMIIQQLRLLEKEGGKSGHWQADEQ